MEAMYILRAKPTNCICVLAAGIILIFSSCVNTKKTSAVWIYKGQEYYQRTTFPLTSGVDSLYKKKLNKGVPAKISYKDDYIAITFLNKMKGYEDTIYRSRITASENNPLKYFFPYDTLLSSSQKGITNSAKFSYLEIKPVFQALSIPVKLRRKLNDTVRSVASSSFNVGITAGIKFTHSVYRKIYYEDNGKQTFLNNYTKKINLSPGWFLGPAILDLKAANTNNFVKKDRSVLGLTTGAFLVAGYNEFNLGLAAGWDLGLGSPGKEWIYHKKMWIGFVLAIDIIK